jgi:hypothetical protein
VVQRTASPLLQHRGGTFDVVFRGHGFLTTTFLFLSVNRSMPNAKRAKSRAAR